MGLDTLWSSFTASLPTLKDAWPTVIGLMLASAIVAWLLGRQSTSDRVASMQGRLDLANDRIAEFDRKLSGASPDEAKAKIERLESRLAAVEPYQLTTAQLSRLHTALVAAKYGVRITRANTSPRLDSLFQQLVFAFSKAGWTTQDWVTVGAPSPPNNDVTLAYNGNVQDAYVEAVRAALKAAEIDYGEQEITDEPSLTYPVIWLASARKSQSAT